MFTVEGVQEKNSLKTPLSQTEEICKIKKVLGFDLSTQKYLTKRGSLCTFDEVSSKNVHGDENLADMFNTLCESEACFNFIAS